MNPVSVGPIDIQFEGRLWTPEAAALAHVVLRAIMDTSCARISSDAKQFTPVNNGLLRSSIGWKVEEEGSGPLPRFISGQIGSPLAYAAPVEVGGSPHQVPRDPIEAWVRRKLVSAIDAMVQEALPARRRRKAEKRKPTFASQIRPAALRERAIKSLTFFIRSKIATDGTPAVGMLEKASQANEDLVQSAFATAMRQFTEEV